MLILAVSKKRLTTKALPTGRDPTYGAGDLVLMARDKHTVPGRNQIGLDEVDAQVGGERAGRKRVLGSIGRSAAVMEVTKWLKPSDSVSRNTVTARVCRPQRE